MTRGEETVKQLEAGNDINDPPCVLMRPEYMNSRSSLVCVVRHGNLSRISPVSVPLHME
jgi:hypothetical protein